MRVILFPFFKTTSTLCFGNIRDIFRRLGNLYNNCTKIWIWSKYSTCTLNCATYSNERGTLNKGERNGKKWACLICVLQDIRKHTHIKHHGDSSGSQKSFHGIKIITREMETRCLHARESKLLPFWENSCLIGKNFKPFFLTNWEAFSRGNSRIRR